MAEISVIVPVYNVQKYLRKCLNSLVKQTFKDIEIIAVNDGSTDDSEEILKELNKRLTFLLDVGLRIFKSSKTGTEHYQGGEAQRIRLATQIGSGLTGVLYILDEPSIRTTPKR